MAKIKIHFVCLSNSYRSRIAEAYMKSLNLPGFSFSSSGLAAGFHIQPVPKHTSFVITKHGLNKYLSKGQAQTTPSLLKQQDLIIFMHHDLYRDALQAYDVNPQKCLYWDVADLWQALLRYGDKGQPWTLGSALAEETFQKIKQRCDMLKAHITKSGWVEVVDNQNRKLDLRLPLDWVNKRGLWSRSVHALITTPDNRYLIEKRARNIISAPSLIDVSTGGCVEAYEEPIESLTREIKQELGITVAADRPRLLEVRKQSTYHDRYKRHTRGFVYSYHVKLTDNNPAIALEESKVKEVRFLNPTQLKKLLWRHRLRHLGYLSYQHQLYKDAVNLSQTG